VVDAAPGTRPRALRLDEALFLPVATSIALSAWVALVLAELGRFSLVTAGAESWPPRVSSPPSPAGAGRPFASGARR